MIGNDKTLDAWLADPDAGGDPLEAILPNGVRLGDTTREMLDALAEAYQQEFLRAQRTHGFLRALIEAESESQKKRVLREIESRDDPIVRGRVMSTLLRSFARHGTAFRTKTAKAPSIAKKQRVPQAEQHVDPEALKQWHRGPTTFTVNMPEPAKTRTTIPVNVVEKPE